MPPPTVDPSRSREPKQTKLRVRQPALRPERGITTGRRHRIALLAKRQRPAHNGTSRSREREQTKLQVWQPALRPERGITTGRPHKIASLAGPGRSACLTATRTSGSRPSCGYGSQRSGLSEASQRAVRTRLHHLRVQGCKPWRGGGGGRRRPPPRVQGGAPASQPAQEHRTRVQDGASASQPRAAGPGVLREDSRPPAQEHRTGMQGAEPPATPERCAPALRPSRAARASRRYARSPAPDGSGTC